MKIKLCLATHIIGLLLVPAALAEVELKGSASELAAQLASVPRTVNVTGEGEVKVQADRAIVTFKVSTEKKSLADSLRANEEIRNRLTEFLKERGLGTEQIRASKFSSTPKYSVFSEKAKSHRVDNLIKVTARDELQFQTIASAADKFAEVSYLETVFEHSDNEGLKAKAIAQACDNANNRKKVFEEKLGLKLTPRRFIETMVSPATGDRRIGAVGGTAPLFSGMGRATPIPGEVELQALEIRSEPVSSFGELVFKVFVTVEFAVESK